MNLEKLKQEIKEEASNNPEKFFATDILKEKEFSRGKCENCGMYFWSYKKDREVCGEPECSGGYTFINNSPTEKEYGYIEAWEKFKEFMTSRGYKAIDRYPVVARWRDDVEFVGGSIYNFQPYIVSGEAEPPAPELIVPQPSLRFNDVDNVGITGRHYVLHNHIGQTCFRPPEKYDQNRYFRDMFEFAIELGIPKEKLILHEDCWGGGGNLGACMEFFVDGLELWNQVYMFYKQTPSGYEELDLKVLDMGMGQERITWISHGTETSYECVMPETITKLKEITGLEVNREIWESFLPHSSELNVDEVDNIEHKWEEIAEKIEVPVEELKNEIKPAAGLYSVAEHMRALIFALSDGKIPSNTGGGHNLRLVYRRAKDIIEKYNWDIDLVEVAKWNAEELEPMFPELLDSMEEIEEILNVEKEKYSKAREKAFEQLKELEEQPSIEEMIELYESHGVSPEMMEDHGLKVPEDFYSILGQENETVQRIEEEFDISGLESTEKLYYTQEHREPYRANGKLIDPEFDASVEAVIEDEWIVLDKTLFYPKGGGQSHDTGKINGFKVEQVQNQGDIVLHRIPEHNLGEGDAVTCKVDGKRRKQLTQHHSATHMVNAAAREELGEHIYQAGANKTVEKGRLDITHYENLSRETLDNIESKVRQIIEENHKIRVNELIKSQAEQKHGFRIYQGGAPPGNIIRLVEIEDSDIEACGGTHLTSTKHAEEFVITDSKRIQDGIIRLEYKTGEAARKYLVKESISLMEPFDEFKKGIKSTAQAIQTLENSFEPFRKFKGELQEFQDANQRLQDSFTEIRDFSRGLEEIYDTASENLPETIKRFRKENNELKHKIDRLSSYLDIEVEISSVEGESINERAESLFETRKEREKQLQKLEDELEKVLREQASQSHVHERVPTENVGLLIQLSRQLSSQYDTTVTLIGEKGAVSASTEGLAMKELEKAGSDNVQGDKNFAKAFDL